MTAIWPAMPPRRGAVAPSSLCGDFAYPYNAPVRSSGTITIQRVEAGLRCILHGDRPAGINITSPVAVAIGPYHHGWPQVQAMEEAKRAALEEFCRVANQPREAVQQKIFPVVASARECYASDWSLRDWLLGGMNRDDDGGMDNDDDDARCHQCLDHLRHPEINDDHGARDNGDHGARDNGDHGARDNGDHGARDNGDEGKFADMMLLDGCFLLQFMVSMCPDDPDAPPEADPLMSRVEVHTNIDAIARDVMLLENQIPWLVLEALMELRPAVPVDRFLALMASAFDVGNDKALAPPLDGAEPNHHHDQKPLPHLLGLFHRHQVGTARTQSLRVPRLSALSCTAVELAEMGVKLTASKTRKFGDMSMAKRQWRGVGPFGKLSLAPVVLDDLTACYLINMAAYEACLGATQADNFAVSSYLSVLALLVNREEDVQELRGKGIISSALSDKGTLQFFKWAAPHLRVGHRYYHIFQRVHEYRQERWVWIAIHTFFYRNLKTVVAVLSIVGVLAGLFKTILSLKQPQR